MSRLVLALIIGFGLCAPGAASAQVWKLKKAKTATTTKAPAKKKAAKPSIKKKKRAASKASKRKVDLVPEESESTDSDSSMSSERVMDDPADEPIIIQVEEL